MTATDEARHLAQLAGQAAANKNAAEIIAIDVSERLVLTDIFLVVSGETERQVRAIVDGVEEAMHNADVKTMRREGTGGARWVLLDYNDIVVHVQHHEDREYYALERLWRDCPVVELEIENEPTTDEGRS